MTPEELREAGVRLVGLVLVDNAGIARMKCVPIDRFARACERGIGWSSVWGLSLGDDSFAHDPGLYSPSGDVRLRADPDAAVAVGCAPGWGWAPIDHHEQSGEPWAGCQRHFLRRMVSEAEAAGIELMAAWELEFSVGRDERGEFVPLHRGPGYGAATFGETGGFLLALADALQQSGISAEQVHVEYADGQMEISLPPADALRACDTSILARHVIRWVAAQQGLRASFSPRVVAGSVGNGSHIHLSVWRDGVNRFAGGGGQEGLHPDGEQFVAGMLRHLPALTALGAPTALSYERLQPSHWAGVYACWGNENREAALRLEGAGGASSATSANVEWMSVDGAANPYLVTGALIAAGLDGLAERLELAPAVSEDPADLSGADLAALGIVRLPEALEAAAEAFAASSMVRSAMGDYLHDRVAAVRRAEAATADGLDEETLVANYRWRY